MQSLIACFRAPLLFAAVCCLPYCAAAQASVSADIEALIKEIRRISELDSYSVSVSFAPADMTLAATDAGERKELCLDMPKIRLSVLRSNQLASVSVLNRSDEVPLCALAAVSPIVSVTFQTNGLDVGVALLKRKSDQRILSIDTAALYDDSAVGNARILRTNNVISATLHSTRTGRDILINCEGDVMSIKLVKAEEATLAIVEIAVDGRRPATSTQGCDACESRERHRVKEAETDKFIRQINHLILYGPKHD